MEKSEDDKILPDMDIDSGRGSKKKHLASVPPAENDSGEDTQSDSENESDSSDASSSNSSDSDTEYECTVCDKTFSGYIPLRQHEKGSKHKKALARKKRMKKLLNKDDDDDEDKEDQGHLIQEPFAVCRICNKEFTGPESYYMHLKSKMHKRKTLEASILKQVKENGEINVDKLKELNIQKKSVLEKAQVNLGKAPVKEDEEEGPEELDIGEYECKTCEKAFTGLIPFTQHLVSKTHAKQIEKKKTLQKVVPEPSTSSKSSDIKDANVLDTEDDILVCKACSMSFSGPENAALHLKSQKHKKKLDKFLKKLQKKKNKSTELKELKDLDSRSKSNEDVIQGEKEQEDKISGEADEPATGLSEESRRSKKSTSEATEELLPTGGNVSEKHLNEKFVEYRKAMQSLMMQEREDS